MSTENASRPIPSKLRLAFLMLAAVYPFVTAILYVLLPLTEGWPIWARTLILAPVMVFSIVYAIAPLPSSGASAGSSCASPAPWPHEQTEKRAGRVSGSLCIQ